MPSNTSLLPLEPELEQTDSEPGLIDIDDQTGVFDVLSSRTAREVLAALYQAPGPASDVAERVETSLQNVTYHVSNLTRVNLVTVSGTWYSSKGRPMKVYAPANDPLVLMAGDAESKQTLSEIIGENEAEDSSVTDDRGESLKPSKNAGPAPLESSGD